MPLLRRQRSSTRRLFLLVFFAFPLAFARLADIPSTLAVTCAGLGCRQGLHAQDLVDLTESKQPQSMLGTERIQSIDKVKVLTKSSYYERCLYIINSDKTENRVKITFKK